MERTINCPGSISAQRGLPPLPEQKVTRDGTDIHNAMETGDATDLPEDKQEIAVRLERLELRAVEQWADANNFDLHDRSTLQRRPEVRFWIRSRRTLAPIASAKLDVHYLKGEFALILDFKSGYKESTPSERNWQLLTQAVALWHEHPEVTDFTVGIAASRLSSSLDVAHYDADQIRYAEFQINAGIWLANQPGARRSPGTWCQYCRANGECHESASFSLLEQVRVRLLPTSIDRLSFVQRMDVAQMKAVWERSTVAEFIFTAVTARLKRATPEELAAVGLKLKPGAEVRFLTDISVAREKLSAILTTKEIDACSSLALGKLASAAKKDGMTVKQAVELVNTTLEGVVETSKNKPSLVAL